MFGGITRFSEVLAQNKVAVINQGGAVVLNKPPINLKNPLPTINSKYWIAVDYSSASIIAGKDIDVRMFPASMTKVLTAYIIFSALREGKITKDKKVKTVKNVEGSRMFLDNQDEVLIEDLIKGMIIQSGNDASINLAIALSGSEENFVRLMNETAKKLGLENSNFTNPHGLPDDNHYSTVSDLAKLAIALIRDFPEYYHLYSEKSFTYGNIQQANRNSLINLNIGVDGIKTGHTEAAGYCLMASAIRGERRVITITAKAGLEKERFIDSENLLNYVYNNTETVKLYDKNAVVNSLPLWKGEVDFVSVGFLSNLYLTIPSGSANTIKAQINYQQPLLAPINAGDKLANLNINVEGRAYVNYQLSALEKVSTAPWYRLAWHNLQLLFK